MTSEPDGTTRTYLAIMVVVVSVVVALVAIMIPTALVVFDKLLPVMMLVLGFYFGHRTGK